MGDGVNSFILSSWQLIIIKQFKININEQGKYKIFLNLRNIVFYKSANY